MKAILSAVAILVGAFSVANAQSVDMNLIHHNIASGGRGQAAANHIVDLMNLTPQKAVIVLNEANMARQHFSLPHSGWDHHWPASPHEGRGNAIFTRDAVANITNTWVMTMQESWTHNQPKDPRVYPGVKVQLVNNPWVEFHCITVHFPTNRAGNGTARQESVDRIIQAAQSRPNLPIIICGDFNMSRAEVQQRIGAPIGGRTISDASVDHIIVRDGTDIAFGPDIVVTRLGTMGSDHQALRYKVTFQALSQQTTNHWPIY